MNLDALRRKAELGDTFAQAIVGICCLDGIDDRVNYGEAFRFLSAAAEKGMPRAIVSLARMYAEGLGIQKDAGKAVDLYERAAGSGEFLAQIALGRIYSQGLG